MRSPWRLMIIFAIFSWLITAVCMAEIDLESSVVCLTLTSGENTVEKNQFFELIDFGSYVLIPLNNLPARLGLEMEYLRSQEILLVSSADKERQIKILLNEQKYMLSDKSVWEKQPPVVSKGSFYVSVSLVEFLAKVKVNWDYTQQELIVQGDWTIKPDDLNENSNPKFNNKLEDDTNVLLGSNYGLSLLRYQSSTLYQINNDGEIDLTETLKLRADGKVGDWSLAIGNTVNQDLLTDEISSELSLIRATYNENDHLIILGDTNIDLEKTLGECALRGFLYMYPDHQGQTELMLTTTIEGQAKPGDKATLFVNGLQLDQQVVGEEANTFHFEQIPLSAKRINEIKVVLENSEGRREIVQKVNANPRILKKNNQEYLLTYGQYREIDDPLWQGELLGTRTQLGLSDKFTLNTEAVRLVPNNQMAQYGISTGGAVKITEGLSCFGDWLAGGSESHVSQGWKAGLLQSFNKGYLELAGFYVPDEVGENVRVNQGEGYTLLSEWDFNSNWSATISGQVNNSLPGMELSQLQQGEFNLGYAWGKETRNLIKGTLVKKDFVFDSEDLGIIIHEDTNILMGEWQRRNHGNLLKNQVSFQNSNFYLTNGEQLTAIDTLGWYSETLYSISRPLWFGLSLDSTKTWVKKEATTTDVIADAQLKWLFGKSSLTGLGTINFKNELGSQQLELFDSKISAIGQFELNTNTTWQNTISVVNNRLLGRYMTARTELDYRTNSQRTGLGAWLEYSTLYAGENPSLWQGGLALTHQFKNGLEAKLQAEHIFEDPWGMSQQNLLTLTLSQSIGFAKNKIHSFAYTEEDENLSFITGVVYLDENGNGKRDSGEKVLSEIEMKLDGRREKTDRDGKYSFHALESGLYQVGFDLRKLDADYTPLINDQLIKVKPNQNFALDFGLTLNGVISGRFFVDRNANGRLDNDEKGLDLVGISLDGGNRKVFADNDGSFIFENVPLGVHHLAVIPDTLPQGMILNSIDKLEISITKEALDHGNILIPIVYKF